MRACADAQIGLKRRATDDFDAFQVTFGLVSGDIDMFVVNDDNTHNRISTFSVGLFLSCTDFKQFWFCWSDGYFYVGQVSTDPASRSWNSNEGENAVGLVDSISRCSRNL